MKIETSLINILDAIKNGRTLSKGLQVTIPVAGESTIYGFIAIENLFFSNPAINMPPLGEATVLSNRVVCVFDKIQYRFPIFYSVGQATEERYEINMLYVPRFLNEHESKVRAYTQTMVSGVSNCNIIKIDGVKLENNIAYYFPKEDDLYFTSSSKLRGLSNGLAVIIRRVSMISGDVKYEIYNAEEVQIENI